MISNGPEEKPRKERALACMEALGFFDDYGKDDFKKLLDKISST